MNKKEEKKYMEKYRVRNRDKLLQQMRDYNSDNKDKAKKYKSENKKKISNYNKKYNKKNKIKSQKAKKEWNKKNKTHRKKYQKEWRKKNLGKERQNTRKRRARMNKIIHDFSNAEWLEKLRETNGVCPDCKKYVGIFNLHLDHIHPISKAKEGQIYTIKDVQPLCKICNSKKGNKVIIK